MGMYTQSIREILQQHKHDDEDLSKVSDMITIANRCIFNHTIDGTEKIEAEYRTMFEGGFLLHFFNEEIGYETLPLWLIALNEKLYVNSDYINLLYANLDKQVFSKYHVRNVIGNRTGSGTKTTDIEGADSSTETRECTDSRTTTTKDEYDTKKTSTNEGTGTDEYAKTGTDTEQATVTIAHDKKGVETTDKTGTVEDVKGGTDTVTSIGTVTRGKTGSDRLIKTGTERNAHTGTQTTEETINSSVHNTGTTQDDSNSVTISSDTPQGSLANLRSPGGDATGQGVSYADGQTYNYMSAAAESDATNVKTDDTTSDTDTTDDTTVTFDDTNTLTRNTTDETQYDSTDTETRNLSDATQYGGRNTTTNNLTDETSYDVTDTETRNTTDVTTFNSKNTQTRNTKDELTEENESERNVKVEDEGTNSDTATREGTDTRNISEESANEENTTTDEIDYEITLEMLYKSQSLLDKVWKIFDDLFMIIF